MSLASIIVHEATHARIDDRGIPYDEQRRDRIERLCRRQQQLFMQRAEPEFRDAFGNSVDWSEVYRFDDVEPWYEEYWSKSRWKHVGEMLGRAWRKLRGTEEQVASATWQESHRKHWDFVQEYHVWSTSMLYTRGCSHATSNNHELAITDFRQVVTLHPDHTDALVMLGSHLYFSKRYEESLQVFLEADRKGYPDLAEWIVSALWRLERVEEALEWLKRSPSDPRDSDLLGTRAMLLLDLQREEEALQSLKLSLVDQTVTFNSNAYSYLVMKAQLLQKMDHMQEFLEARHQLETIQDDWHRGCVSTPLQIPGYVIETDPQMFEPGVSTFGATVLICPDEPNTTEHAQLLESIATRIAERIESDSNDYESIYLRGLLTYQEYYPWREVPMSLTEGREVWAVDLNLDRIFLPGGYLEGRIIQCWTAMTNRGQFVWLCDDALDSKTREDSQPLTASY